MIYKARYVLPITSDPISDGEVLVKNGVIEAVGKDLQLMHPEEQVIDLSHTAILPGFVNGHTHLDYTVFRGIADDEQFLPWILTLIKYGPRLSLDDFLSSCRLGAMQMVSAGVTTIADASYSGVSAIAASEAGLRGTVCVETFGGDPDNAFAEEMMAKISNIKTQASELVAVGISPHSPYTSSAGRLSAAAELARANNMPLIIHVAESGNEVTAIRDGIGPVADFGNQVGITFHATGKTPVEYLADLGVLGDFTVAAHCVHVTEGDIAILAHHKTGIAHCPKSNCKLGTGIAPFSAMVSAGARVGIGTDSSASGDPLDMIEETRFALLLQRGLAEDTSKMDAVTAIRAATFGGAEAMGFGDKIGSIETGKRADIIAVDISKASAFPAHDPYSAIVYSASASDVVLTMVDGVVLYRDGRFTNISPQDVIAKAGEAAAKLGGSPDENMQNFFAGH